MLTILTVILFASLILFVASLIVALRQDQSTTKASQYLIAQTLGSPNVNSHFGRAARRPTRVLGTFIF